VRAEAWTFGIVTIFFLVVTPVYLFTTKDPTGSVALIITFCLAAMITGYIALTSRKMDRRPEDRKDGEITEGAGEVGFFPPFSIWPLFTALTLCTVAMSPVFGWWLALIGVAFGAVCLTGWIYQFYRGDYAH